MYEFKNCTKVAQLIKRSRRIIQSWINMFNSGGLEGNIPGKPPGRPSRLSKGQMEELEQDVLTHPRELGYNFNNWERKSVSHQINKKFNVDLKVRQYQNLLHKMKLSLQRPRYDFPKPILKIKKNLPGDSKKTIVSWNK